MASIAPYLPLIGPLFTIAAWIWFAGAYSQRVRDLEASVAELKADHSGLRKELLTQLQSLNGRVDSLFAFLGSNKH